MRRSGHADPEVLPSVHQVCSTWTFQRTEGYVKRDLIAVVTVQAAEMSKICAASVEKEEG